MYETETLLRRQLQVRYPAGDGRMVLRSELDWDRDEDFLHLVFPLDEHDERAWGRRLHLPLQLALGKPGTAGRGRFV